MTFDTSQSALEILSILHGIEQEFGRDRSVRWGPRTLDLDLIALGDVVLPDAATVQHWMDLAPQEQARRTPQELILPHPRVQDRAFVLVPLCDVAPEWCHPITGASITRMLAALPDTDVAAIHPLVQ